LTVNVADGLTAHAARTAPKAKSGLAFRPAVSLAAVFLVLVVAWAVAPTLFTSETPFDTDIEAALQAPSLQHWFGTDASGRDIFTRVVFGARSSLLIGAGATALALIAAIVFGFAAGLGGRFTDGAISRFLEVVLALPGLLLALLFIAVLGPGVATEIIAVAIGSAAGYAWMVRGQVIAVKDSGYVSAAVALEAFLSAANLTLISGQAGILLLASLGATLVIVAGSVDLSVGSIALLTGAVLASLINAGVGNPILVLLIAIAVGAAIGLLNGVVFAYGRVPSFIATLGTLSLFAGIGLTILQGSTINFTDQGIRNLAIGQLIPNIQNAALIAVVAFLVVWFFARRTRFGLYVYAVGGNERVVELAGVSTRRVKVLILIVSGITAGLAGLLLTAQLGAAGPTTGSTILLDSVVAIVIGGTALSGGVGGVGRTVLGVLILTVLSNGLNQIGAADYTQTIIKGLVIIVAAVFTMASQRKLIVK
jgi:ribose transport system permease protein